MFAAFAHEARPAIVDLTEPAAPRPIPFRDLDDLANAVARGLRRAGVQPQQRVGIVSLNRWEFVATLLGAFRAGVVPVPVNVKLAPDTVAFILKDAAARLVFCGGSERCLCPAGLPVVEYGAPGAGGFDAFLDPGAFVAFEPQPDSVLIQPYTSGSTGRPKGVVLSHYSQNWSRLTLAYWRRTTPADVILVAAPLYHKNALNAIKQGLTAGAMLPLMPQFHAERYIQAIGRYRCTVISGVPTMMAMVLAHKELLARTDVSSVRTVMMGSAPASRQLLEDLAHAFPDAELLLNYGITEAGPVPLGPHPEGRSRPLGSVGVPYPGTEAKLIGSPSPDEGELLVRNPGLLLAYHNLPEETAKRLRDGWFHTGDVFRRDAEGFYYFVGRTDDMFVCGGENIFPVEVESLLERHPDVRQAVVLPFAHETKGHVPFAFVVPRAGAQLDEAAIKSFALANGPAYQHPRRVFFLERMPLAGTNKVDKDALRRLAAQAGPAADSKRTGATHG
ncbi:MAG: class I adenylate-forming enzyme family protein [Pseudomonadota bacterium]